MARVLIVDDEEPYRRYLATALEREGLTVCTAASGVEAIASGRDFAPDVLLADWRLEYACSGLDVACALQAELAELQVVVITGYAEASLRADADVRLFRVLEKPFDLQQVISAVHDAIAQRQA